MKNHHTGELPQNGTILHKAPQITIFLWLTLYANISFLFKIKNVIKYLPHNIFIYTEHFLCILNQKSCLMINNSNLIPWLGIKWNMATIYSVHYIPKFVFLENVCRVLLHPLPIRHVYHLVLQGVDSINEPIFKKIIYLCHCNGYY